jgi:hypothetical protein
MILNSPTISGSLTVTGNIIASGSITLSGSVASASYADTASFVALAQSASNAVAAQTASFANAFTVASTLTAQTLVVQTITSSVDFVTGSTRFGSSLSTSTHQFTGSVSITGSLAVVTTGTEFQVNSTGVNLGNALTDSHIISGSLRVNPNGLFVSGSGLVGIGTTSPEGVLTIQGTSAQPSTSGTTANSLLQLVGSLNNQLNIGSNTVAGDYGSYIQSSDNNLAVPYPLNLQPNGGNVGIGTSTPSQKLEVVGGEIKAGRIDSSNEGGQISFGRSTDNATAWYIDAYGNVASPQLRFVNVTNAVVAMTITGSNVGIGTSSPSRLLEIQSGYLRMFDPSNQQGAGYSIEWASNCGGSNVSYAYLDANTPTAGVRSGNLLFATSNAGAPTEKMRITSGGFLKVSNNGSYISSTGTYHEIRQVNNSQNTLIFSNTGADPYGVDIQYNNASPNNGTNNFLYCVDSTTLRAAIRSNGGLANYSGNNVNLASDRRLKKDIFPLSNEWNNLKNIEVVKFRYKDSNDETALYGAIAQQVQEVYPELVVITREATESEPEYYGLREQPFQWLTTKVLQEAMAKIEQLEAQINELKAQ